MASTTTTVVGWTFIVAIGGFSYWQYRNKEARNATATKAGRATQGTRPRAASFERQRKDKSERPVSEVESSPAPGNADAVKNRKKKKDGKPQQAASSAVDPKPEATVAPTNSSPGTQEMDDKAFARQLASKQAGTSFKAPEKGAQKVRTTKVKGTKSQNVPQEWQSSGPSSSTGGEAEEDASPAGSPALNATTSRRDPTADMLEEPAPGPASLRVVPSEKPQRERAPKQPKAEPEGETKKQRQRRKKREAEKAQAAADETERRRLMEKQLKTARTAEGTAKSGEYRTYTPPTNAWNQTTAAPAKNISAVGDTALLDTFETDDMPVPKAVEDTAAADAPSDESRPSIDSEPASSAAGSLGGDRAEPVIVGGHDAPHLSASGQQTDAWEDYQVRGLEPKQKQKKKDADGWQEVPSKGKKKAAK